MEKLWIFILVPFFATLDKAETVQLEETPPIIFDEIFGEGWWDNGKDEEWHKLTLEQNVLHQIGRQNTQIGQIEPNSTDQRPPLTESDHSGQIEPNSTDQLGQIEPNENIAKDERKHNIVAKFHEMKGEFKKKGKFSAKEWNQIEQKIAEHLKVNRKKIYKWKKELGINQKVLYEKEERQKLVEKFDQKKAELKRDGFKNSYNYEIDETVAKELALTFRTISNWKRKLGQTKPTNKYSDSEKKELIKRYYEIKGNNSKISDKKITKMLNIGADTLVRWKRQFIRQQLHPNSVDVGHSVEENAAANVQEIENSN